MDQTTVNDNGTPIQPSHLRPLYRDGASQAGRLLPMLDPDYVSVDERSLKDFLAFAREYAKELLYFDVEHDGSQTINDWSAFLGRELDLDEVVQFIQEPEKFSPEAARPYARPHFALFLTFLQLLRITQGQLNTLTRRHLDFYYQKVLRITKGSRIPDRVNVLVDLVPGTGQFRLPAGTLLNAGTDSLGLDLVYQTDRDIVVNQAQVVRESSVYVDKLVTGIREARERYDGPADEAFVNMLQIALGDPSPGDPLPQYDTGEEVDYDFLVYLRGLVDFVGTSLYLDFTEFRSLMRLKLQRDQSDSEWEEINRLFEKAARSRTGNPQFQLDLVNPRDFDTNLDTAIGGPPNFDGITEVSSVYDLYHQRIRQSVQQFIREQLHFEDVADFFQLMQIKVRIDHQWDEINRILEEAGRRQRNVPEYVLAPEDPTAFGTNLSNALGPLDYTGMTGASNLDDIDEAILRVERFFAMSAEDFSFITFVAEATDPTPQQWDRVYRIMENAHRAKSYAARRLMLRRVREEQGYFAMLEFAVGDAGNLRGLTPLERLQEDVSSADDAALLEDIHLREETGNVAVEEWNNVYRIVELSQRARLSPPPAQKEEWLCLYPREDTTTAGVNLGNEGESDHPRWKTFGQINLPIAKSSSTSGAFGWAISSPILALSQGQRTIVLTLGFAPDEFQADAIQSLFSPASDIPGSSEEPFHVEVSTENGWIQPERVSVRIGDYQSLSGVPGEAPDMLQAIQFELSFEENIDAIAPLTQEEARIETPWPVLRLMLRHIWRPEDILGETGRYVSHYQPFRGLKLAAAHVKVSVSGLTPLQVQNDETALDANKPFEPFGVSAAAGSRFYLGHPEIVDKRLDGLRFNVQWMGVPGNLEAHYRGYPDISVTTADNFTARVSLIDNRIEVPLIQSAALFAAPSGDNPDVDASGPHTIEIADLASAAQAGRRGYLYERAQNAAIDDDLLRWDRYLQWELNTPDLQILTYPSVVAQKSIALATATLNRREGDDPVSADDYHVNPPYTPKIKTLSLDYTSSVEVRIEGYGSAAQIDKVFQIQPFGYNEVQPEENGQYCPFLPQFDFEGELYIGIQNAKPPQNLSLLFQMAEGSADPDLEPAQVQWSYLSGNKWVSLDDGNILLDTTRGLINSGIIILDLEPAGPNTLLPAELYWLRAAIPRDSNSLCDTVAIEAQAVSATFVDQDNAPGHLGRPLPTERITELAEPEPEIRGIRQPYTSFGGEMEEQEANFYTRASERLRHKQRSLTMWDYEHIVLEKFSQIYKAKCLPSGQATGPDGLGRVDIIVIPDIRNIQPFDPFEPKAPADLLADIEGHLSEHISPFANVRVKNADYVPVKVRFSVRFLPGYNEGFHRQLLSEELNRFLAPWAYDEGSDIIIGGRIYANVIINFLEERHYVDYVANIKLFSSEDGRDFILARPSASEGYWVETSRPDGVLVAARQHEIDIISEKGYEEESFAGIRYMKIELDFIVS